MYGIGWRQSYHAQPRVTSRVACRLADVAYLPDKWSSAAGSSTAVVMCGYVMRDREESDREDGERFMTMSIVWYDKGVIELVVWL